MLKKFSNAQEVHIFSSSNVKFYTLLSRILDCDSEISENDFFFSKNLTSSHHVKSYFSKFYTIQQKTI